MSRYAGRIAALRDRARRDRRQFEAPAEPPDEERALVYLRTGVGPAIAVYIEGRTGADMVRFDPTEYEHLEGAMNNWLELYTRCYGVDLDARFTVRTAAEVLLDTHDIQDVARVLTDVPPRDGRC